MSGNIGHIPNFKIGHIPRNKIRQPIYAYGYGNVIAWWSADYGTDTVVNGASITTWKDKVKGSILRSVISPTYTSSDANFNNKPSIKFSTTKNMTFDNPLGFGTSFSLLCVYKLIGLSSASNGFLQSGAGNLGDPVELNASTTSHGERLQDFSNVNFGSSVNDTNPHVSVITPENIRRDGISVASGGTSLQFNSATQIGSSSANRGLNADIVEIIMIDRTLTTLEMDNWRDNARQPYGL